MVPHNPDGRSKPVVRVRPRPTAWRVCGQLTALCVLVSCGDQGPDVESSRLRDVCAVRNVTVDVMFVTDTGLPPRAVGFPATLRFSPVRRADSNGPGGCEVRGDFSIDPLLPFSPSADAARGGQFTAEYGSYFGFAADSSIHLHLTGGRVGGYFFAASLPFAAQRLGTWATSTVPSLGSIVLVSRQ